jgi:hypothetical protein
MVRAGCTCAARIAFDGAKRIRVRASAQLLKQCREFRLLRVVQPRQPRTERFCQERKPARHRLAPFGCKDEPVTTQIRAIDFTAQKAFEACPLSCD